MGNLCALFSKYDSTSPIQNTIPLVSSTFEYDISNNQKISSTRFYPNADIPVAAGIPVASPLYNQTQIQTQIQTQPQTQPQIQTQTQTHAQIQDNMVYSNPPNQPHIVIVNRDPYYNDSGSNMITGFFGGMLMGKILDNDCY